VHGKILDQQMIGLRYHLYQAEKPAVAFAEVDEMLNDSSFVVGGHGLWFPANQRNPLGIGRTGQRPDLCDVGHRRPSEARWKWCSQGHFSSRPNV
jgi:hypothetical protein